MRCCTSRLKASGSHSTQSTSTRPRPSSKVLPCSPRTQGSQNPLHKGAHFVVIGSSSVPLPTKEHNLATQGILKRLLPDGSPQSVDLQLKPQTHPQQDCQQYLSLLFRKRFVGEGGGGVEGDEAVKGAEVMLWCMCGWMSKSYNLK